MSGASESTRGIRTLPDETAGFTSGEVAWIIAEAAKGLWVHNETPTGVIDGVNTTFTLANAPISTDAIWLYWNGVLQRYGASNDYTVSGVTITTNFVADAGYLTCTYRK